MNIQSKEQMIQSLKDFSTIKFKNVIIKKWLEEKWMVGG